MNKKLKDQEAEDLNVIKKHKKIAAYLKAAAEKHIAAAKCHEEGEHEEAYDIAAHAHGHTALAAEAQMEMLKHYPFTS
jgi:hypothetical protein